MRPKQNLIYYTILFITLCFSLFHGVKIAPDTGSYTTYSIIRGPGYPLWLKLFQISCGTYWQICAVICQVAMAFVSIHVLLRWIQNHFSLPCFGTALIGVFLVSPLIWGYSNYLLSEALAYPLFLLCVLNLWKALEGHKKNALAFGLCLTLLTITRQQYVFFAIVGLIVAFLLWWHKKPKILAITWVCASVAPLLLSNFADRTYHHVHGGPFVNTPFAGLQFVVLPISSVPDLIHNQISNPEVHDFLKELGTQAEKSSFEPWTPLNNKFYSFGFHLFYNYLCWTLTANTVSAKFSKIQDHYENNLMRERFNFQVACSIIKKYPFHYLKNYALLLAYGAGGYYALIILISMILYLFMAQIQKNDLCCFVTLCALLIHAGNISLVSFLEPPDIRYIHTTQIIAFSALILFFCKKLLTKLNCSEAQNQCAE